MPDSYKESRLSVVVIAFNQPHELANSLTGIAVQIQQNPTLPIEVIVVDNGSDPPLEAVLKANPVNAPMRYIWRAPVPSNFRPASARNVGLSAATGVFVLFMDGDCIPAPGCLNAHWERLSLSSGPVVTLGHRVFIDGRNVDPGLIRAFRGDLDNIPEVRSTSNYELLRDRRMEEFDILDRHPMPFNCCHGCNIGVRRHDIEHAGEFDEDFDGYWGYEDIEFGHRMWAAGAEFLYLSTAYLYHQEAASPVRRQPVEIRRNYELACRKIPGFKEFRDRMARPWYGPLPEFKVNEGREPGGTNRLRSRGVSSSPG